MSWLNKVRTSPWTILFVVSFALFVEESLYGAVGPTTPGSPARIKDEHLVSMLYGAYALGMILVTPVLGLITDRIGRRLPMIIGVVLLLISTFLFLDGRSYEVLFAARIIEGIGAAATWTAGLALVAEYFVKRRVRSMGYAMLGATLGTVVGPFVGGEICDWFGYAAAFYVLIALFLIDATLRLVFIPHSEKVGTDKPWKATISEFWGIVSDRSVLSAAFAVALAAASWAIIEPLFPMRAVQMANATPATIGMWFTVSNLLYAILAPVVDNVSTTMGIRPTIVLGLELNAIFLPLLALSPNLFCAGIVVCLMSFSYAFTLNPTSAELGDAVDRRGSKSYAVAYAVYNIAFSIGMIFVDGYVEFVTEAAHKLELLHILLIMSALFVVCIPLFSVKQNNINQAVDTPQGG